MRCSVVLFAVLIVTQLHGQTCSYFPADCPQTGDIESAQDADACTKNMMIAQEISMQNQLRTDLNALMSEVAKTKNWELYEYTEVAYSGSFRRTPDDHVESIPYDIRPPHQYALSFVFIVNQDSLEAWKSWYNNDLLNASNKVVDAYRQSGNEMANDNGGKKYLDSANFYGEQKTKYMTTHAAEYQNALVNNNANGQKKFENELKKFDDKINYYTDRASGQNTRTGQVSKAKMDNLDQYKKTNTTAYRNGTMIRVSFDINENIASAADNESKKIKRDLHIPNTALSVTIHNSAPDENEIYGQYLRSTDYALLLLGKWSLKQDQYNGYHSLFSTEEKSTDLVTPKKIACDKVQTIAMHVEGSDRNIQQFLHSIDVKKIEDLVYKN